MKLWMTSPPVTLAPDATIGEAAFEMGRRHIRRLLVVDHKSEKDRLQGIVTLTDVARAFPPDLNPLSAGAGAAPPIPVREVMSRTVYTVTPTTTIADAAFELRQRKVGALPVLLNGEPVGVVTESDVFRAIVEMSGVRRPGTSVTLRLAEGETPMEVALDGREAGLEIESFFCMTVDGRRTITLRTPGRVRVDALQALGVRGRTLLDVQPPAID